jgi:hypothetical protein
MAMQIAIDLETGMDQKYHASVIGIRLIEARKSDDDPALQS